MSNERTEDQIFAAAPVEVVLGGKSFLIAPQPRSRSRAFRAKFRELCGNMQSDMEGMANITIGDDLIDLIYVYSKELAAERDWIEENANDEDCASAFGVIVRLVFGPFARTLTAKITEATNNGNMTENIPMP